MTSYKWISLYFGLLACTCVTTQVYAQAIRITNVNPVQGPVGTSVTITGGGFGTTTANNVVYFGATRAVVTAANNSQLTVTVPHGGTFEPISVTALPAGVTAYATQAFVPTYNSGILTNQSFTRLQVTIPDFDMYCNVIADFDNDGKTDIAVTRSQNTVSVFRNGSTTGTLTDASFNTRVDLTGVADVFRTMSAVDLDGDGKKDLVIGRESNSVPQVFLFRNTSTSAAISFVQATTLNVPSRSSEIAFADLDLDGKTDIVANNSSSFTLFRNTTVGGTLSFTSFIVATSVEIRGVAVADLDADGQTDLVLTDPSNVSIYKNIGNGVLNSTSFTKVATFPGMSGVKVGDIDRDGKTDIIGVAGLSFKILKNNFGSGTLSASSFSNIINSDQTQVSVFALADLNGDNKIDIGAVFDNSILGYNNSQNGALTNLSYSKPVAFAGNSSPNNISIGDLDNDGKPEIVTVRQNQISIYRNAVGAVAPAITDFTPASGPVGTMVSISLNVGINYLMDVKLNNIAATTEGSPEPTKMWIKVPVGASTGRISLQLGSTTITSATDFVVDPPPSVTSFTPANGAPGTVVTITGAGFSTTLANNIIKFGTVTATATLATSGSIVVPVPADAITGKISVTVSGQTATSTNDFVVSPSIDNFSPSQGLIGAAITITGKNFSTIASANTVKFNGVTATVTNPSTTSLTVAVPTGASSGKITVTVDGMTATSVGDFTVTGSGTVQITGQTFPATYTKGSPLVVSVTVNNASQVSAAVLKTRGISQAPGAEKSFPVAASANKFEFSLPASELVDPIGQLCYFEVTDNAQNKFTSPKGRSVVKYPANSQDNVVPNLSFGGTAANYQIVSIPLNLANSEVTSVFSSLGQYDDTQWRLFDYSNADNREYPAFTSIAAGKGYWLIVRNQVIINPGEGSAVAADETTPFTLNLVTGWNLIGNPYNFRISWDQVLTFNNNPAGVGKLKVFTNGVLADNPLLDRFRGGFVFCSNAVSVRIPVTRNTSLGGRIQQQMIDIDQDDWQLPLVLRDGVIRNETGAIGMNRNAMLTGKDDFDEVNVPMLESIGMSNISFDHAEVNASFSKEIVPSGLSHAWTFSIENQSNGSDMTLHWDHTRLAGDRSLVLVDEGTARVVDMRRQGEVRISPRSELFHVLFGSKDDVKRQVEALVPVAGQPYPNPALGQLMVPFYVNEDMSHVSIRVYDQVGRTIATLAEGVFAEGTHEVTWKTDDFKGVCIVRMKIGGDLERSERVAVR